MGPQRLRGTAGDQQRPWQHKAPCCSNSPGGKAARHLGKPGFLLPMEHAAATGPRPGPPPGAIGNVSPSRTLPLLPWGRGSSLSPQKPGETALAQTGCVWRGYWEGGVRGWWLLGSGGHRPSLRPNWGLGVMPPQVLPQAEGWTTSLKTELPLALELSEEQRLQVRVGALGCWLARGRVPQGPPLTWPPTDLQGVGGPADHNSSPAGAA